jgi:hypothetical protein
VQVQGTKLSFYDYFNVQPRCGICNEIGFQPLYKAKKQRKEMTHRQEQILYHSYEMGLLLYKCSECSIQVHP